MQAARSITVTLALLVCGAIAGETQTNPLAKTIELLEQLAAKIAKDGEVEAKAYHEYVEWCDDNSKNLNFEIKTAAAEKAKLEARIAELAAAGDTADSKIEELGDAIAKANDELKSAGEIRDKEAADFAASEAELMDALDVLDRAIAILEREMAKNPAAFAQIDTSNMASLLQSLSAVIDAAAFSGTDRQKLMALVQSQEDADDVGAPAAAVYKTHSTNIVEVLEDMKEKAESQLSDLRKAESNAKHNYEMLKQSLEDQIKFDTKDMDDEKAAKAEAAQGKAAAEGDLDVATKELKAAEEELEMTNANCMQVAADHEATVKGRDEELKTIAEALKILKETTSGAEKETYSLLQIKSTLRTSADLAGSEVVAVVKRLAKEHHSAALAQLASRISAVIRYGAASGEDPFVKVKGLIRDLIARLEAEAVADATEKAYCDEEMAKTEEKQTDLEDDIAKLTSKIDQAAARSAELKEQVKELEGELAQLAKEQAEMDKMRADEHAAYVQAKADLEEGLLGVRNALSVLRDYYANKEEGAAFMQQPAKPELFKKAQGAGDSIIGILEVVESDFAKNLAQEEREEADAQDEYDRATQENNLSKARKEQDVKYKTQEYTGLDKAVSELTSDRENANTELAAVNEYYDKLKERCVAKPETYEERKARRASEIAGLKEALAILNGQAFLQRKSRSGVLRGALQAGM